ncbi:GNAT family N-acetyltransferase [Verrucomicrobiaceae bacterium N1E253]|uniref:GNAT family N-acetyltransferase n=1 Tax=Oceaniferula marina TaxID=2748318 RepID=A0A851GAP7_9BACT|nr:GNAT family N-acetyltransferase [Oceaniferula marina]NWK54042.1 GNAT family N-acetyltransferase [Oceaniferula marina]
MTIRNATPDDCQEIHTMICELASFEQLEHKVCSQSDDLKKALFEKPIVAKCLVAEAKAPQSLAAFALFYHNYSSFTGKQGIYLEDIYVRPDHRGTGIGKKLILEVLRYARENNCPRVDWAVLDWNQKAIDFYRSLGATVMSDWRIARIENP